MSVGNLLEIILPVSIFAYCFFSTRLIDDCLPGFCSTKSMWERYPFLKTTIEIIVMFTSYELTRVLVALLYDSSTLPFETASLVIRIEEQYLKIIPLEYEMQNWALQYEWLIIISNHFYKLSHWTSCAIFVTYFFIYKRSHFYLVKYWFIVANLVAFSLFISFPLAPPRLVSGLLVQDTIRLGANYAPSGSLVNQFAAMPSMHFGYSLLFTIAYLNFGNLSSSSGYPREKMDHILWNLPIIFYPIFMLLCIVITGNHFILDAMVASVVVILSLFIVVPFTALANTKNNIIKL